VAVTNYETVFIATPEIANDAVETLMTKVKKAITDNSGTLTHEDRWGRRRLAYPIQGQREGFYVVLTFSAEGTIVSALEHLFRVTDTVVRHLTIRIIKKNKTFPPRRVKPAGATADAGRPGSRGGYSRPAPVVTPPPSVTAAAAAAAATTPAAPAAEAAPVTPPSTGATPA
jgi:small subunit ribosomal protein S6